MLVLPVGNVILDSVFPYYVHPDYIADLRNVCSAWEGFTLVEREPLTCHLHGHGRAVDGVWYKFAPNSRGDLADIGYIPVAFTVNNYAKALDYTKTHYDTPVALITEDSELLTLYNKHFIHYWTTGKPKSDTITAEQLNDLNT